MLFDKGLNFRVDFWPVRDVVINSIPLFSDKIEDTFDPSKPVEPSRRTRLFTIFLDFLD